MINNFIPFFFVWWPLQRYLKLTIWGSGTVKSLKQPEIVKAKQLLLAITTVYLPHLIPLFLPTVQPHWPRPHHVVPHLRAWLSSVPYAWNALCSLFMWQAHSHPSCVNSDFSDTEQPSLTALGRATSDTQLSATTSLPWFPSWHSSHSACLYFYVCWRIDLLAFLLESELQEGRDHVHHYTSSTKHSVSYMKV